MVGLENGNKGKKQQLEEKESLHNIQNLAYYAAKIAVVKSQQ